MLQNLWIHLRPRKSLEQQFFFAKLFLFMQRPTNRQRPINKSTAARQEGRHGDRAISHRLGLTHETTIVFFMSNANTAAAGTANAAAVSITNTAAVSITNTAAVSIANTAVRQQPVFKVTRQKKCLSILILLNYSRPCL